VCPCLFWGCWGYRLAIDLGSWQPEFLRHTQSSGYGASLAALLRSALYAAFTVHAFAFLAVF
jgi:hypothetical protein